MEYDEFYEKYFVPKVKVLHKLDEFDDLGSKVEILIREVKTDDEIEQLGEFLVVYYKNERGDLVMYHAKNARNLVIKDDLDLLVKRPRTTALLDKMKTGLSQDIEIILANDSELGIKIIIDGVHRTSALYKLWISKSIKLDPSFLNGYAIKVIELKSRIAHKLFPHDIKVQVSDE